MGNRLESDVNNHHKHYWCLVQWLKGKRKDAFYLGELFGEGCTVAHEIWRRYEARDSLEKIRSGERATNSIKPKMPSFDDIITGLPFVNQREINVAKRVYDKIARHFELELRAVLKLRQNKTATV
jgi:hypothetical protein